MSGKELLKLSSAELAELSEADLKKIFAPYLVMLKPEEKREESGTRSLSPGATGGAKKFRGPSELEKTMALMQKIEERMKGK